MTQIGDEDDDAPDDDGSIASKTCYSCMDGIGKIHHPIGP